MKMKITVLSAMITLLFSCFAAAQDSFIVYQKGNALFEEIAEQTELLTSSKTAIPVEKDKKNEAKEAISDNKEGVFCAIGPQAAELTLGAGVSMGVAVGIANPFLRSYDANGNFDFISFYPEPRAVFEYLSRTISARSFGVIFTKRVNQEMADYFSFQARNSGYSCKLLGVNSSQELVAQFPEFVKQVDATLLLIDPIAYSNDDLKYVVIKSVEGKKPVFGFSESMASAGVPIALVVPSKELSRILSLALTDKKGHPLRKQVYFSENFNLSVNVESARVFGLKYEEDKVVQRY